MKYSTLCLKNVFKFKHSTMILKKKTAFIVYIEAVSRLNHFSDHIAYIKYFQNSRIFALSSIIEKLLFLKISTKKSQLAIHFEIFF